MRSRIPTPWRPLAEDAGVYAHAPDSATAWKRATSHMACGSRNKLTSPPPGGGGIGSGFIHGDQPASLWRMLAMEVDATFESPSRPTATAFCRPRRGGKQQVGNRRCRHATESISCLEGNPRAKGGIAAAPGVGHRPGQNRWYWRRSSSLLRSRASRNRPMRRLALR